MTDDLDPIDPYNAPELDPPAWFGHAWQAQAWAREAGWELRGDYLARDTVGKWWHLATKPHPALPGALAPWCWRDMTPDQVDAALFVLAHGGRL